MDVFDLPPTDDLSVNEIAAAKTVQLDEHNAMSMRTIEWEPSFAVARAFRDQAERAGTISADDLARLDTFLDRAERFQSGPQKRAAVANLHAMGIQMTELGLTDLGGAVTNLAGSLG